VVKQKLPEEKHYVVSIEGKTFTEIAEFERYVIGCCINDNSVIPLVQSQLKVDHFFSDISKALYQAVIDEHDKGNRVDFIVAKRRMKLNGVTINSSEMKHYLSIGSRVEERLIETYCKQIKDFWKLRTLLLFKQKGELAIQADNFTISGDDMENILRELLMTVEREDTNSSIHKSPKQLLQMILERNNMVEQQIDGSAVKFGVPELDDVTGGMMPNELVVVGARPGVGKTELATKSTYENLTNNVPVLFITLEVDDTAILGRLIKYKHELGKSDMRKGKLTISAKESLEKDTEIERWPLYVVSLSNPDPEDLRTLVRKYVLKYGVKLVVVDHLHLIKDPKFKSGEEAMALKSRAMKVMAKDNGIPVLLLAQLSRSTNTRKYNRPEIGDLKGSGAIEADADMIYLLWRPEMDGYDEIEVGKDKVDVRNQMKLLNPKFRGGKTTDINVGWYKGQIMSIQEAIEKNEPF
jgi:replicative DNA helicase